MSSRVAVVTGGASGMGAAICRRLAAQGHAVTVMDINDVAAQELADELVAGGAKAIACGADVSDRVAVDAAIDRTRAELGPVAIMVTSAGMPAFQPFAEITPESWRRIVEVNLTGTFHCVQSAIGDMVAARWGRVVTVSSSSAQRGSPRMTHYAASKGGVIALTKSLAREYATHNITVNTIPPSGIETPMTQRAWERGEAPGPDVLAKSIPLGRLGSADDIAAACAFLCSEDAGFITGQVIGVNGGSVI
jgi:2-hydroxycyclohexanecarboxyl-CoA dehydrogenase